MPRDRYDERDDRDDNRPRRRYREDDDDRPPPRKSGLGVVFLVLGIVCGVVVLGIVGLALLLMPAIARVREAAARNVASNNAKQIVLGAMNFESAYGSVPGPFIDPRETGGTLPQPASRMSWRVALLPYIEQENVYRGLDLTQPWDSPRNQQLTGVVIKAFGDPEDPADASTRFRCFYDNGALFESDPKKRVSLNSPVGIPDGIANTLLFAESADRVPWAQFNEWQFDPNAAPPPLGHPKRDGFLVAMADGSVRFVKKSVSPATLRSAVQRADGIPLGSDW